MTSYEDVFKNLINDGYLKIDDTLIEEEKDEEQTIHGVKMDLFKRINTIKGCNLKFEVETACGGAVRKAILIDKNREYKKALHVMKNNKITDTSLRLELVKDYCYKFDIQY